VSRAKLRMGRGRWLQGVRKATQLLAVGFIFYAALSAHWRNFKEAHNSKRIVGLMTNEFNAVLYDWNTRFLSLFGDPAEVSDGFLGGPWAAEVFGLPLTDPWNVASVTVQSGFPPLAMLLGALVPLVLALLLGKVFCSFLCPARLAFEVSSAMRLGLQRIGLILPAYSLPRVGLGVGLGALGFSAFAGAAIFHLVLPYLALSAAIHQVVLGGVVGTLAVWVGLLVLADMLLVPGQVCRSLCPTGALLEEVGRRPALVLASDGTECPTGCNLCQRACPYGLFPGADEHRPGCDSCGRCTPVCPERKLAHRLVVPLRAAPERSDAARRSLPMAASVLLLVSASLLIPGVADAHHNKGLPHYGYFENYPQVPTEEYVIIDGRWEAGATLFNFQGLQRRTSTTPNDIRIFAYVYDLKLDEGFEGGASLDVLDRDGVLVEGFERLKPDEESVYRLRITLPKSGPYTLRFRFETEGEPREVTLPFRADLAVDRVNWLLIGGMGVLLAVVFALALAGRTRRHTARAPAAG